MALLLLVSGLLMALLSGVFLSFSDFVMRGLRQAPAAAGSAGMVGLNRTVYRSFFMVLFMGFLPVSFGLAILAMWQSDGAAVGLVLAGSLAYVVGCFGVTGLGNVPLNNGLDALANRAEERAAYWPAYARRWTVLNHLRTLATAVAAVMWVSAAQII